MGTNGKGKWRRSAGGNAHRRWGGEPPTLYTGPECPACETARWWLLERGIAFEECSVEDPKVMKELLAITGKTTIPVLELPTGELLIGWEPRRWIRALDPERVIL